MIACHLVLLTYCDMLWLSVAERVSCRVLEKPEIHSMDVGVTFLPLAVCVFAVAAYDCVGPA